MLFKYLCIYYTYSTILYITHLWKKYNCTKGCGGVQSANAITKNTLFLHWLLCRCQTTRESNGTHEDGLEDVWHKWTLGCVFRPLTQLSKHVSGVRVAAWWISQCQEVIVREWRQQTHSAPKYYNDIRNQTDTAEIITLSRILLTKISWWHTSASTRFPLTRRLLKCYVIVIQLMISWV